ncbi:unnamed protein product [Microthlaspi erraticum]|uniref:FBD domain-containing protein n=1 Tax=Microthlaspi erraticum TaxID=1685480 RepID=A0A6D2HSB1_9BRAS|nr:unnamed protein product [Microthlaspi erraticum]
MEIVAPHVRFLELRSTKEPCTLVNVSSLIEASLDLCLTVDTCYYPGIHLKADDYLPLQNMVLKMLANLQNVKELTFGSNFLQILSLAELRGISFPTLKVQTLTVSLMFARSVIPGIERLLQNSPGLKKLIAHAKSPEGIENKDVDRYLDSQGLNPNQCWKSKYEAFPTSNEIFYNSGVTSKLVASFIEMVLKNVKTLETLIVALKHIRDTGDAEWFEELLQMPPTLSNSNNVSIEFRR